LFTVLQYSEKKHRMAEPKYSEKKQDGRTSKTIHVSVIVFEEII